MMFISGSSILVSRLESAGLGFFEVLNSYPGPTLIVAEGDRRLVVYLQQEHQFLYNPLENLQNGIKGLHFPTPRLEIDPNSVFDPERGGESLGDVIFNGVNPSIVSSVAGNGWGDTVRLPLWSDAGNATGPRLLAGFRKWRLTIGTEEKPYVLWERPGAAE